MRTLVAATTLMIAFMGFSTAQAEEPAPQLPVYRQASSTSYYPATNYPFHTQSSQRYRYYRGNVFDRLLEMERRTGAWPFGGFRR